MKLCECGCGRPAPVAKRNRYGRGQRKGEPLRFISGHNSVPIPPMPGASNPNWLGTDAGYFGIHLWLNRNHTKSGVCSDCGQSGKTHWAYRWHPLPHTRDIADYRELCGGCHLRFDRLRRVKASGK